MIPSFIKPFDFVVALFVQKDVRQHHTIIFPTIEKLLKCEAFRMDELKQHLLQQKSGFEEKYRLSSDEFCRRYEKGAMGDDHVEGFFGNPDIFVFIDEMKSKNGDYQTCRLIKHRNCPVGHKKELISEKKTGYNLNGVSSRKLV